MRKQLFRIMVFCAACLALAAQAQYSGSSSSPSSSSSSSSPSQGSAASQQSSESGWIGRHFSPTGRMHKDVKASQLNGAEIKSSSGETLGTLGDYIVDANSGRIDFAILTLSSGGTSSTPSSSGSATSPSGTSSGNESSSSAATPGSSSSPTTPSTTTSSTTSSAGKQVAVPWMLLRLAQATGAATTTATPSFTFSGDKTKLDSAPSFDASTDISQSSWRQQVFSFFGLTPGSATGGAESPGGTSGSSSSSPSSSSSSSGSTPSSEPYTPKH